MGHPKRNRWRKHAVPAILLCAILFTALAVRAQNVQWNVVDGGGGISTGGGNTLWSSVNQAATLVSTTGGTNSGYIGYIIQLPQDASVDCLNGGVACAGPPTYYGISTKTFTFRNAACGTAPCAFERGGTQYYRYLWKQAATYTDAELNAGSLWSDRNAFCPGGTCDKVGTSMTLDASTDGSYYLIVRSYNGGIIGTDQVLGPYQYDAAAPTFTSLDANNVDYNDSFVDGLFDLAGGVQDLISKLKDNSCEYRCSGDGGLCDGTWRSASDNWSGTATSTGTCSITNITCTTNLANITLEMRVQDNAGNLGTASSIARTCDIQSPTNTSIGPAADVFQSALAFSNSGAGLVCSDGAGESGLNATPYDVEVCNDGAAKGGCTDSAGTWVDGSTVDWSANNYDGMTGAAGNWYRFRGKCRDNVQNSTSAAASYAYSPGYVLLDTQAPTAFACAGVTLRSASGGTVLAWDNSYNYTAPTGPFMEWTSPGDNPAGTNNSGVAGYYVYFGTNSSANPQTDGTWQTGLNFTNSTGLVTGTTYYFKISTRDNAGNVSTSSPACAYHYSTGGYLHITQFDDDGTTYGGTLGSTDNPEGVLAPDNTDYEIIQVKILDENDDVVTTGPIASKSVTITLGNLGTTGAYIAATNLGGAAVGAGVTSTTGTLVSGQAYVKIKANGTEAADAITVTPTASGLSGIGGRNQTLYLLVRTDTSLSLGGDAVDTVGTAATGDISVMPVWSHSGNKIAYLNNNGGVWNIYKRTYGGGVWGSEIRLTSATMNVRPGAGITWSGDDAYIIFSAKDDVHNELEIYAVKTSDSGAVGDDAAKSLAGLRTANQKLSNMAFASTNQRRWADTDWSSTSCSNGYQDSLVASMASIINGGVTGADLWRMSGTKAANGLYIEDNGGSNATVTQLTNIPGLAYLVQPRWSHDCSKVVFAAADGVTDPAKTSIYILNLTDSSWGATVSGTVTSLSAAGVYKIHDCTTALCTDYPGLFPSFSSDDTFIFHSVDTTSSFSLRGLQKDDVKTEFFTGKNFNNYAVYIQTAGSYVRQEVGQSANNEFGLLQCHGASCPDNGDGNPVMMVTQSSATKGDVRFMYLSTESTVTSAGGLAFLNGAVAAVIPAGALTAETEINVATPSWTPAPEDAKDLLVSTGDAREFFPDGVVFNEDILMIFHYNDANNDGVVDSTAYDENKIYVYYWCDSVSTVCATPNAWIRLDGSIDPTRNIITVVTNHFSLYDPKALRWGMQAPGTVYEMHLANPHTYPNPWRSSSGDVVYFNIDAGSTFNTQAEGADGTLLVNIDIYDVAGKHVRTVNNTVTGLATLNGSFDTAAASNSSRGLDLAQWDMRNTAGRMVASGVYLYQMTVRDGFNKSRTVTGKLAVIK